MNKSFYTPKSMNADQNRSFKLFVAFGRVNDLCVYYMTGTPEGSTESGFMEKSGIEPATPCLQDIGLSPTPRLYWHIWVKPRSLDKHYNLT